MDLRLLPVIVIGIIMVLIKQLASIGCDEILSRYGHSFKGLVIVLLIPILVLISYMMLVGVLALFIKYKF